jgi:hypothetical protein
VRVADLVAQIVGPAAKGVDVVKVLMEPLRQQGAGDVEILVVVAREPARVGLGVSGAPAVGLRLARGEKRDRLKA